MTRPCPVYRNEDSVGAAIRQAGLSRSELFVTTKWSGLTSVRDAIDSSLAQVSPHFARLLQYQLSGSPSLTSNKSIST